LTRLNASWNNVSDLSPLSSLIRLTNLYLGSNPLSDISPLRSLINLESLTIGSNVSGDITALNALQQLRSLHLTGPITADSVRGLGVFPNMRIVYFRDVAYCRACLDLEGGPVRFPNLNIEEANRNLLPGHDSDCENNPYRQ